MLSRLGDLIKYRLERLLLRGMYTRLFVMAATVGLTSLLGGLLVVAADESFNTPWEAIWWAFLRLTDPGYLGDDQGTARRTISATLTVLGYVLFMGSLIAVMTQWLNQTIRDLERGLTRIARRDHLVVVGWTSRTPTIAKEMFATEGRVRRFLALHTARKLHLVLMVERLEPTHRATLRDHLGRLWREGHVIMRSGSPLHMEHLERVDYLHAAAILLPSDDVGGDEGLADAATVKTLRSIDVHSRSLDEDELPLVVTEIFDVAHVAVARRAYRGPLEIIASDRLVGRLMALTVLQPGVSHVITELLAYGEGNEIHIAEPRETVGMTFAELPKHYPRAVPLGFVRREAGELFPYLCPPADERVRPGDLLVHLAQSHEDSLPTSRPRAHAEPPALEQPSAPISTSSQRFLIIGWSDRVPDLIAELAAHHGGSFHVDIVATVSKRMRRQLLSEHDNGGAIVQQVQGDATKSHIIAGVLEPLYDGIVLVSSDWLATGAQSDARTILSFLLVRDALAARKRNTRVVVELMDEDNSPLVSGKDVDVVVSPLIIGRVLAHVTLRRELRCVYDELFDADNAALGLLLPSAYGIPLGDYTFAELEAAVSGNDDAGDHILMGIVGETDAELRLNAPKEQTCTLSASSKLLVLRASPQR